MMHSLTTCSGYAVIEDKIVSEALEFWNAFVEFVVDAEFEDDGPRTWLDYARGQIAQAFQELWIKVRYPPAQEYGALDSDKQREFRQFRADVADLLVSAYPVLRGALTEAIARGCLDALSRQFLVGGRGLAFLSQCHLHWRARNRRSYPGGIVWLSALHGTEEFRFVNTC